MSSVEEVRHAAAQRRYFERRVKATMVPRSTPYLRRHVDELIAFAGLMPGERMIEVGCGMGRYTLELARRGFLVEGLDLSPVLLERLRHYAGDSAPLALHCADVAHPPAALYGRFDAALALFTLHHVHSLETALSGIRCLLRPGGRLALLEPNPYNPLYYAQIALRPGMSWAGDGGLVRIRRRPVFAALKSAGFVAPRSARFGFFPPFLGNRPWGARLERVLERVPIWSALLPFQLFAAVAPAAPDPG